MLILLITLLSLFPHVFQITSGNVPKRVVVRQSEVYNFYIPVLNFRIEAMLAFTLIFGTILPVEDVNSVVTPGPCPDVTQLVCTTMPTETAPFL